MSRYISSALPADNSDTDPAQWRGYCVAIVQERDAGIAGSACSADAALEHSQDWAFVFANIRELPRRRPCVQCPQLAASFSEYLGANKRGALVRYVGPSRVALAGGCQTTSVSWKHGRGCVAQPTRVLNPQQRLGRACANARAHASSNNGSTWPKATWKDISSRQPARSLGHVH